MSESEFTDVEIQHIAVEIGQGGHGDFLTTMSRAWIIADMGNKEILRPAMVQLIKKYKLEKLMNYDYGRDMGRRMVEECNK